LLLVSIVLFNPEIALLGTVLNKLSDALDLASSQNLSTKLIVIDNSVIPSERIKE